MILETAIFRTFENVWACLKYREILLTIFVPAVVIVRICHCPNRTIATYPFHTDESSSRASLQYVPWRDLWRSPLPRVHDQRSRPYLQLVVSLHNSLFRSLLGYSGVNVEKHIRTTMSASAAAFSMTSDESRSPYTNLAFGYWSETFLALSSLRTSRVNSTSGWALLME
jgi:hypothetical protein